MVQILPELGTRAGGPPIATIGLSSALVSLGVDCIVVASTVERDVADMSVFPVGVEFVQTKVFRTRAWDKMATSLPLFRQLQRLIASRNTVVHIQGLFQFPQWAGFHVASTRGVPFVVTPRGALDPSLRDRGRLRKRMVDGLWQRSMLDSAAAIHYTTGFERQLTADLGYRAPTVVIPNGLSPMIPDNTRSTFDLLPENAHPVIGYHGRIDQKKGLPILVKAFGNVVVHHPNARLLLIGPDSRGHMRDLKSLCEELGLGERVIFAGTRTRGEIASLLERVDVWAMPTLSENFGNGLVEAMSVGLPCVTTAGVNIAPVAEPMGGLVIAERTEASFSKEILGILGDKSLANSLAVNGRAFASQFDWEVVAKQFIEVYERSLASQGFQRD